MLFGIEDEDRVVLWLPDQQVDVSAKPGEFFRHAVLGSHRLEVLAASKRTGVAVIGCRWVESKW